MRPEAVKPLPMRFVVRDLRASVRFYSAMFACAPAECGTDRARWDVASGESLTLVAHASASDGRRGTQGESRWPG